MEARQRPILHSPAGHGVYYRRWRAWAICTADGTMAELSMDPDKAQVWTAGGHKVINFVHDEPIEAPTAAPTDGQQGTLLP